MISMSAPQFFAIILIFVMWALYSPILNTMGRGTLNAQLHVVRLKWMRMLLKTRREHRTFDGILLGQISGAMAFFGSATLIVLAGLVGTLANISNVHRSLLAVPFFPATSLGLFTLHFATLTIIMAICFFSFTYALRKLAYTLAMIGALEEAPGDDPESQVMIMETAIVMTEAVKSLNNGIRGFYFAVAALVLFVDPYICMITTMGMSILLYYRQGFSTTALAIERYVNAMHKLRG
jgi:uncharacterized membrane protein